MPRQQRREYTGLKRGLICMVFFLVNPRFDNITLNTVLRLCSDIEERTRTT